jgi:hypothetical protein
MVPGAWRHTMRTSCRFDILTRPRQDRGIVTSERAQRQIERLLDEADEAISAGDWNRARERARDVLTFDPDSVDAQALLTAADRRLGEAETTAASLVDSTMATSQSPPTSVLCVVEPPCLSRSLVAGLLQLKCCQ